MSWRKKICGIYKIKNKVTQEFYIGKTIDLNSRWNSHISALEEGTHNNINLQFAWRKYGYSQFSFEILEICLVDELSFLEWKHLLCEDMIFGSYNIRDIDPFEESGKRPKRRKKKKPLLKRKKLI